MKTSGKRTRIVAGKRYPDYDKQDMAVLAYARRWLNANGMKEHSAFTTEEGVRRVAFYAAQVEAEGRITRWLAPSLPKPRIRYRTRFTHGDALGRHLAACAS